MSITGIIFNLIIKNKRNKKRELSQQKLTRQQKYNNLQLYQ
jgi:hypothetical protein